MLEYVDEEEHYSFGPWLIEVTSEKLIPPQYIDYKKKILAAEFAVKVPINKDRKDVQPGMLLYRQVLVFGESEVTMLTANGSRINEITVRLKDIKYVIRGGELLNNYIDFGTEDDNYSIEYYTVAEALTSKILRHIRNEFRKDSKPKKNLLRHMSSADHSLIYKYFLKKEQDSTEIKAIAHQKEMYIIENSEKFLQQIINRFNKRKMDEVLFMTNGTELIIASGDIKKVSGASVNYSYQHLYINLSCLDGVSTLPDEDYIECRLLTLMIGGRRQRFRVYDDFYSANLKELIC